MPGKLQVAFWNVQNLFEPGVVVRGPQSQTELNAKLGNLSHSIGKFFDNQGPDLLALAEVNSQQVFHDLESRMVGGPYVRVWEGAALREQTGLGVFGKASRFSALRVVAIQRPTALARPRVIIVECHLIGKAEPFVLVVNHWKSRMPSPLLSDEIDRRQSADWLGNYLANERRMRCVIAVGDFNAEPFEAPFGELRLRARRTFSSALWSRATPAYLYNTAWKYLSEPDSFEQTLVMGYRASRPKTSHGTANVFDQLLVSGAVLRRGMLRLQDGSIGFVTFDHLTSEYNRKGALVPLPWKFISLAEYRGTSDHFPLTATFTVH